MHTFIRAHDTAASLAHHIAYAEVIDRGKSKNAVEKEHTHLDGKLRNGYIRSLLQGNFSFDEKLIAKGPTMMNNPTKKKYITNEIASAGMRMLNASNARYLRFVENGKLFALEIIVLQRRRRRRRPQNSYFIRNRAIGFTKKGKEEISFSKCSHCGKRARSIVFVPFDFVHEKGQTSRYSSATW